MSSQPTNNAGLSSESLMRAGDLVDVDFGVPIGSEPGWLRPAIVVTASAYLEAQPRTLHVVPLTTNTRRLMLTEVEIDPGDTERPSVAQCHVCQCISRERIVHEWGNVGPVALAQLRSVLADLLDID
jgi:mRNA interferase MazF